MKLIDRLKKDKDTFNRLGDRKAKKIFLWDYYKIPIFTLIIVLLIGVYSLINYLTKKPILMYAVLVNSDAQIVEVDNGVFVKELEKAGVETDDKIVDVNDYLTLGMSDKEEEDIETLQVLNALFSISDLDIFVGFKDDFDHFINGDAFLDLSLYINKDILAKNEANLYKYKDSNGNEIVGGVILHPDSSLHKAHYYHSDVIIGIASNAVYLDNSIAFVTQMLSD